MSVASPLCTIQQNVESATGSATDVEWNDRSGDQNDKRENNKFEKLKSLSLPFAEFGTGSEQTSDEAYNYHGSFNNVNDDKTVLDVYDVNNVPVDLSNDIAVNQMLADEGAPADPDAEVFKVNEYEFDEQNQHRDAIQQKPHDESVEGYPVGYSPFHHTGDRRADIKQRQLAIKNNRSTQHTFYPKYILTVNILPKTYEKLLERNVSITTCYLHMYVHVHFISFCVRGAIFFHLFFLFEHEIKKFLKG